MKKFISLIIGIVLFPTIIYSKILVIDPGHDYENINSVLPRRTATEVNTNWEVANRLMALVNSDPDLDWTVILTRHENDDDDHTVEITERKRIAKEQELQHPGEVFFLSIHCNAYGDGTGFYDSHGTEAFYCTQTYNSNNQLINRYASPYVCNMRFC